jgi:uncharacterized membrane protein YphA (DoxX/SURF4 family)
MNDAIPTAPSASTSATGARAAGGLRFAALLARVIVGGLFAVSAVGKLVAPETFLKEIRGYELVALEATNLMAYTLPWLELLCGALLLTCLWRAEARLLIALLLVVFTGAKAIVFFQGRQIECGCGGSLEFLKLIFNNPQGIFTNLALLALLSVDWKAQRRPAVAPRTG